MNNPIQSKRSGLNSTNVEPPHELLLDGLKLHQSGKLDQAADVYRLLLSKKPNDCHALHYLGLIALQKKSYQEAVTQIKKAIRADNNIPAFHFNLGNAYKGLGKIELAAAEFLEAVKLDPLFYEGYCSLGLALSSLGRLSEAETNLRNAIALKDEDASIRQHLGRVLQAQGKLSEASANFLFALQIEESPENKIGFAQCIKNIKFFQTTEGLQEVVVRAIDEGWGRPNDLIVPAISLVKLNRDIMACVERSVDAWLARISTRKLFGDSGLAAVSDDALLQALMKTTPVSDMELERFLTLARYALLEDAANSPGVDVPDNNLVTFFCALACQCFINDYIFDCSEEELARAGKLRDQIAAAIQSGSPVNVLHLIAVASYFPIFSLPSADSLLNQGWPEEVAALLVQQVREPMEEQRLRTTIPCLTPIEDEISCKVRQQYEEHPYPKWTKSPFFGNAVSIDTFLHRRFPDSTFKPVCKTDQVDILIGGCGTGQQSTQTAMQISGASVLAIDLSLTSLSYAKRMTGELGLTNIEYAQADIMGLGSIGRTFDVIESVGVLHHMADPLAGWRTLVSLLRPNGVMRLGFYSELGRKDIVAARQFIAERGYDSTVESIRRCRQELMAPENSAQFGRLTTSSDFYSTSHCRDLLFHVHEHRFTIPQLKECINGLGLKFLGFLIDPQTLVQYGKRFPDDRTKTSLGYWNKFENENPLTFAGMYQFLVQKSAS